MAIEVIRRMMPLVLVALPTVASACPLGGGRPMFQFENDMRGMTGKDSDDAYTAGARLGMKDRAVEADKGSAGLALRHFTIRGLPNRGRCKRSAGCPQRASD